MLVELSRDHYGGMSIEPIGHDVRAKISAYLKSMKYAGAHEHPGVYLQDMSAIMQVNDDFALTEEERDSLNGGWPVEKDVDTWLYLSYVGYNAAEALRL